MPSIFDNIIETERKLNLCYDLTTGEVDEAKEAELNAAKEELIAEGAEKLCNLRAEIMANLAGLEAELNRLTDKTKTAKKKLASLEDYILLILSRSGEEKIKAGTWTVGTRRSTAVRITDPNFSNPRFFITKTTEQLDKVGLKDALKKGEIIPGAELATNYNLSVK